ncbi:hypothetical protein DFH09DRAFT_1079546 [Mycena vulgaris]|nr:hypothetical protein DFH09DRAFT_1079546 [Mycena vulgaris]
MQRGGKWNLLNNTQWPVEMTSFLGTIGRLGLPNFMRDSRLLEVVIPPRGLGTRGLRSLISFLLTCQALSWNVNLRLFGGLRSKYRCTYLELLVHGQRDYAAAVLLPHAAAISAARQSAAVSGNQTQAKCLQRQVSRFAAAIFVHAVAIFMHAAAVVLTVSGNLKLVCGNLGVTPRQCDIAAAVVQPCRLQRRSGIWSATPWWDEQLIVGRDKFCRRHAMELLIVSRSPPRVIAAGIGLLDSYLLRRYLKQISAHHRGSSSSAPELIQFPRDAPVALDIKSGSFDGLMNFLEIFWLHGRRQSVRAVLGVHTHNPGWKQVSEFDSTGSLARGEQNGRSMYLTLIRPITSVPHAARALEYREIRPKPPSNESCGISCSGNYTATAAAKFAIAIQHVLGYFRGYVRKGLKWK